MNTLNLNGYFLFPQGSMVMWKTNGGAQLAYEQNPSLPDLLWTNNSVTKMTDGDYSARIYLLTTGQNYWSNAYWQYWLSFPKPGNYQVSFDFPWASFVTTCLVIVTKGLLQRKI